MSEDTPVPRPCLSTHGGAGYAPGSYWKVPDTIVCGICGTEIYQPHPTGFQEMYPSKPLSPGFLAWLWWKLGLAKRVPVPRWGSAVVGQPPERY
jgi:hypothetical protein